MIKFAYIRKSLGSVGISLSGYTINEPDMSGISDRIQKLETYLGVLRRDISPIQVLISLLHFDIKE